MPILWLVLGLAVLTLGAEVLIRGAVRLASAFRLPSLVIGLTVVAYGTSAPECAVSMKAGLAGQVDIAVGNVVGSNTFNVLFILGISALIAPLAASRQLVRTDVPIMIGVSLLAWLLARDGSITRIEGSVLVAGLLSYTAGQIWFGRRSARPENDAAAEQPVVASRGHSILFGLIMAGIGLVALMVGANWFVSGATDLARWLGASDLLIGLTIVAAGTSMPEVATSIVASFRGQRDIAIGNIVGSNVFNLLGVLGGAAVVASEGVAVSSTALSLDIPIMLAVTIACLPIFFTAGRISRWEGAVFLGSYLLYITYLVFAAMRHRAVEPFGAVVMWFVIPLTALGILLSVLAHVRNRPRS